MPNEDPATRSGARLAFAILLVGAALGAFALPAASQTVDDALRFTQRAPTASDARSLGRGGTGRAGVAGPEAFFYNPAGLGWMDASAASGALGFVGTRNTAQFAGTGSEASVENYAGHAALAYHVPTERGSLVLGGAYNQTNTFGRALSFRGNGDDSITRFLLPTRNEYFIDENGGPAFDEDVPSSLLPFIAYEAGAIEFFDDGRSLDACEFVFCAAAENDVESIGRVDEEGRQSELNLGGGIEVAPGVMLGLSANAVFGRYQFVNQLAELDNGANDSYEVVRDGRRYVGLDEVQFEERFESELTGINLRGGLSAEAAPGVRLGLTVESPTYYTINETFTQAEITTFFDDDQSLSYGGLAGDPGVGEIEYSVRTPWRLGAGAQVDFLPITGGVADLTLRADAERVDWSELELDADGISFARENRDADERFQSVVNVNLGAEYRIESAVLRAGFAHRPSPAGEGAGADRLFYSAGLGYRFSGRLQVDAGWMRERFDSTFTAYPGAPVVEEEVHRDRLLVGLKYFF